MEMIARHWVVTAVLHNFNLTLSFEWSANWKTKSIIFLIILHLNSSIERKTKSCVEIACSNGWNLDLYQNLDLYHTSKQYRLHVRNAFALNAIHAQNTLNLFSHVLDSENLLFFCLIQQLLRGNVHLLSLKMQWFWSQQQIAAPATSPAAFWAK